MPILNRPKIDRPAATLPSVPLLRPSAPTGTADALRTSRAAFAGADESALRVELDRDRPALLKRVSESIGSSPPQVRHTMKMEAAGDTVKYGLDFPGSSILIYGCLVWRSPSGSGSWIAMHDNEGVDFTVPLGAASRGYYMLVVPASGGGSLSIVVDFIDPRDGAPRESCQVVPLNNKKFLLAFEIDVDAVSEFRVGLRHSPGTPPFSFSWIELTKIA